MDRLTIRNADGSVSQPYWPEGGYWKAVMDKLARYEDTGLEPEECAVIARSYPRLFDMVAELNRYKEERDGKK